MPDFRLLILCGGLEGKASRVSANGLSVLLRMDSIPKQRYTVMTLSLQSFFPVTWHLLVCQHDQVRFLRSHHWVPKRVSEQAATGKCQYEYVATRAQSMHARVADGICTLIWNMRANGRLLHIARWQDTKRTKHHPRQSHLVKASGIRGLPNFHPHSSQILPYRQCGWPMVAVTALLTICHPAG